MPLRSKTMRTRTLFLRNGFAGDGRWGIPLVRKQQVDLENIRLIAYSDTKPNDNAANKGKGVHFFVDDYRFSGIYNQPDKSLGKLAQYKFLLTPDFSTYAEMPPWRQLQSVSANRWVGAYWQSNGLTVIPTVSWSTPGNYEYCFDGVERHAIVAIGTIGCWRSKRLFLSGYRAMLKRLDPEAVICFGKPFDEMGGKLIVVDYLDSRRGLC